MTAIGPLGDPPRHVGTALWRWCTWFAVLTGLAEGSLVALARVLTHRITQLGQDFLWMALLADAAVFAAAALGVRLTTRRLSDSAQAATALAVFLFLFVLGPLLLIPRLHPYAALTIAGGIGLQGSRMIRARLALFRTVVGRTLWILIGLAAVSSLSPRVIREVAARRLEASLPQASSRSPNVILIVLDTVRAQSLDLYGYSRETSPSLDRFASTGVTFERAFSTSPWTLPSHGTMFTGRFPHELTADWQTPLDDGYPTVAERFAAHGYLTAAFVGNLIYCTAETGLSRGFVHFEDYPISAGMFLKSSWLARALTSPLRGPVTDTDRLVSRTASDVNREFGSWLVTRPDRPFFVFLNYFDAHGPYLPPPPFDHKFGRGGPAPDLNVRRTWSKEEIQRSLDAYDDEVAYVDYEAGRLLDLLKTQGLLDNTLIVIVSDHGEQFGEHGLFDHANSLYRQVLQVPLILSFPGRVPAGRRITDPASLVDLPATLLDLAGLSDELTPFPGRSLSRFWQATDPQRLPELGLLAEVSKGINLPDWLPVSKGPMKSIVTAGMHYIRHGGGREELYDFERDVAEVNDLANHAASRATLEESRRALDAMLERRMPSSVERLMRLPIPAVRNGVNQAGAF